MLVEIVPLIVVLIIDVLVARDVAIGQAPGESSGELAAGPGRGPERQVIRRDSGDGVAAGQADRRRAGTILGAPGSTSRFALQNWSVRSRLILLVFIPSATAIAFAADRIVSSLQSAAMVHGTSAARDRAITSVAFESLVLVLILALAVVTTAIVGRSMVRPLRRLQAGALDVAERRLPEAVRRMNETGEEVPLDVEPIDVGSSDEIGAVARAFDQVHREALRLAANEAALRGNVAAIFVNLSRRSQSLVERQIRLIDDLEQGEQDPERLSSLFQMDHLATRMRRNSENLLVLAGHEESRRWNQPLALVDVLRASLSEIEHYERVTLSVQPGIVVRGQVVSDVVHLTAELVENATSFSAVETPVKIAGHLLSSGGALLEITDQGVGMETEELAHANWRLDNPPVVDVAVSRRMGLFVVARLAARHGIRVRLRPADPIGLVALVWLPDEVIQREGLDAPLNLRDPGLAALTAEQGAAAGLRFPARYAPLRVDAAATSLDLAPGDDERPDLAAAGAPSVAARLPSAAQISDVSDADGERDRTDSLAGVAMLAGDSPVQENRLPIFEAVESDWFRRGGQAVDRFARDGLVGAGWASPADEGWRAAEVVHAPSSGGITPAGLPRRVPQANLVPGTAAAPAAGASSAASSAAASGRSASATRDRFASFQRGVRQGRAVVGGDGPAGGGDDASDDA
jgi:signal transduction histidine kinase